MTQIAVVGAGITGLAAAWEAHRQGADVVVLEGSDTPGGKLRTSPVAGVPIDESADAFLARVPEAVDLCRELGMQDQLVAPATGKAYIWARSELKPLPKDQLLGVPTDLETVAASGILSTGGLARAAEDLDRTDGDHPQDDEAVGELVRRQLGDEVHDLLVAPLIGGIWAGDCDRLSVEVAAPALAQARNRDTSLIRGARAMRAAATADPSSPVFLAPRGGMSRLVDALAAKLGDRVRLGQPVEKIQKVSSAGTSATGTHWRIEPVGITAEAVVIATPAPVTARLVAPHSPRAAEILAGIEHAPVALATLAVPRDGIDNPLDGSGFLVPAAAGLLLTACSWASSKWGHLAAGPAGSTDDGRDGTTVLLRASAGRDGDHRAMTFSDGELLQALKADLRLTMGLRAEPVDVRIGRWAQGFPQPRPGHLNRVATLEQALAEDTAGLAVAGAWARGVGIPACIRSGRQATLRILNGSTPLL